VAAPTSAVDGIQSGADVLSRRAWAVRAASAGPALRPIGLFVASRFVVLVSIGVVFVLKGPFVMSRYTGPWPDPPGGALLPRALGSWDAAWYLTIADHGYFGPVHPKQLPGAKLAFFPVWPGLLRVVTTVTGLDILTVGIVLSLIVGAACSVALWWLVRELCGSSVADRAVALWVFFPGSYVLSLMYAEGLTVAFAAVCLLALLRRRWWVAGLAAGVATGVQPDAVVLVACCAWAAGWAVWRDRQWKAVVAPVLSLAGIVGYFAYLWAKTGDVLKWYHVENSVWSSGNGFYDNTVHLVGHSLSHWGDLQTVVPALGILWALAGLALMVSWRPPAIIWIFTLGLLLVALASAPVGTRPRLLLVAFPLIVAVVRRAKGPGFSALLAGSGFLLGVLTMVTFSTTLLAP
jgi:Dolichyl-phosphate-mannose-protein mannosyltransferase